MINQQLLDYIKQQSQQGVSNEQIKQSLLSNGWQETDIDEAFNRIKQVSTSPKKRKWKKIIFIIIASIVILILVILSIPKILGLFGKDIEPIDDSDLQIHKVSVADDENAFFDLMKIRDVIYEPADKSQIIYDMYTGKTWDEQVAEEIVLKNSQAFAYFKEASSKPKYQIPEFADPANIILNKTIEFDESNNHLGSTNRMSRLSIIKALYLAKQGKDKEALEVAFNPVRIGQKIQDSRLSLIEYLVSISMKKYGLETVQKIIPSLKLSNNELKQYIEELDEFYENEEGLIEAFKSEYFAYSLLIDSIVNEDFPDEGVDFIYDALQDPKVELNSFNFQPNKTKALFAENARENIKSVNQICGEITESETKLLAPKNFIQFHTEENAIGKLIHDITQVSLIDVTRHKCQEDLLVGVTQAMIAIKAFKNDTNNYPESLNDLVPDYLSSVPQDPFDGKSLKYSKTKKILYSVGMDIKESEGITNNKWKDMANPTFKINF